MTVHVQVRGPAGGVAGAIARLQIAAAEWRPVTTDATGHAVWLGVPVGLTDSALEVSADGYQAAPAQHVVVSRDVTLAVTLLLVLPPLPTRDEILSARGSFQGLTVETQQYGRLPWFDPFLGSIERHEDRQAVYAAKRAAGARRLTLAVSYAYRAQGQAYSAIPGRDFSQDLPALHALMDEAIRAGFFIDLRLAGDGEGAGPGYNDPQGDTYGRAWLMANFERIHAALEDLDGYTIYTPGFDGVWYGWADPQGVRDWLLFARSIVGPTGYLGIEWQAGKAHLGDSGETYTSPAGQCLDVIWQEFPYPLESDLGATWQIGARLLGPAYRRPPDQPANNDPGTPPWYLAGGTPRGPFYVWADEYDTYGWVRGCSLEQVERHRAYLKACGFSLVG